LNPKKKEQLQKRKELEDKVDEIGRELAKYKMEYKELINDER
jgi:hypothetical protein